MKRVYISIKLYKAAHRYCLVHFNCQTTCEEGIAIPIFQTRRIDSGSKFPKGGRIRLKSLAESGSNLCLWTPGGILSCLNLWRVTEAITQPENPEIETIVQMLMGAGQITSTKLFGCRTTGSGGDCVSGLVGQHPATGSNHYSAPGDYCQEEMPAWFFFFWEKLEIQLNKYLLGVYYVSDTGDKAVNKIDKNL